MENKEVKKVKTIGEYHKLMGLPQPLHPLISLVDYRKVAFPKDMMRNKLIQEYYTIGLKRNVPYKFFYGQEEYDFDEGIMTFISPQQIIRMADNPNVGKGEPNGYLLFFHPDLFWNSKLAEKIKSYDFFGYSLKEALFLSEKEEYAILEIFKQIEGEYQSNIDKFSQNIIISHLELLLNYAERYYERQFLTRNKSNHEILSNLEDVLNNYFGSDNVINKGLPTVQFISEKLNLSPNYLSSVLKVLTGQSTQQHIQNKLIENAKEKLASSNLSISEIAFQLGFEHSSSFTKLFKNKTQFSPSEFRKRYN